MANATSLFVTMFLCFVTFFVGAIIRSAFGERVVEDADNLYLQPLWRYLTRDSDLLSPVANSAVFPGAISLVFYYFSCLPRNAAGLDRQPEAEQPVQNSTRKEASGRIL